MADQKQEDVALALVEAVDKQPHRTVVDIIREEFPSLTFSDLDRALEIMSAREKKEGTVQ
jgi:hypothetical protein